ncbi:hypothetical protein QQX98_004712 [Neonectria punicea]|uniref:Uncharacterized protein n=1 Tax=Neonectria punicea TaxID=979145 RepID=A0ABR1H814_9HYPO
MSMPRDFTVNGIGRLGITVMSQQTFEPLQENSLEFTGLAFAIHAGVSILEKPEGRQTLQRVGLTVVREWARIYYNLSRVSQMASAARQADDTNSHGRKMATRFRTFLFMFAVTTAHELTHLFVGYLAQGQDSIDSYTPPRVSYLNYAGLRDQYGVPFSGESGRWLESRLFGGSIEFYRDVSDDNGQVGIPHVLDSSALARKIQPHCVLQLVTRLEGE